MSLLSQYTRMSAELLDSGKNTNSNKERIPLFLVVERLELAQKKAAIKRPF